MSMPRLGVAVLLGLLASGSSGLVHGQIAPRLTGAVVMSELDVAQHDLSARAASLPKSSLASTSKQLADMEAALRKTLGKDADQPLDIIDAKPKSSAYRAHAAVQRVQAFLAASKGCFDADTTAMADALAVSVSQIAGVSGAAKLPPVIDGVETADHRPLFVLRNSGQKISFALVGANLFDAQCENPTVTATDAAGKLQALQPTLAGASPNRIELELAAGGQLSPGGYVLHVVPKHKAFLLGCGAQPEAVAVVQVAAPEKLSVSYALTTTCRAGDGSEQAGPAIAGTMPDFAGANTVSKAVDTGACADPVRYTISAGVTFADGHKASVGPISQIASAGITAGLPGGLTLSWDPSVRQLFVRAGAGSCKGVY
ncbi:hypothetical protein PY254_14720 [Rhodanobacter sp. AS-Z3]|uniref:hypothetical protein n=1 Tax=Rhodanobacter sp. AS-Z3 TaxID=3031330 RepID=UPI0024783880|nr:hypothetical protein [Rhodanobacter sp. AS-Z3]WEN14472.1 hypothetical protein PY254_14720 [Rhodanobacter sp. AS-Z3]